MTSLPVLMTSVGLEEFNAKVSAETFKRHFCNTMMLKLFHFLEFIRHIIQLSKIFYYTCIYHSIFFLPITMEVNIMIKVLNKALRFLSEIHTSPCLKATRYTQPIYLKSLGKQGLARHCTKLYILILVMNSL